MSSKTEKRAEKQKMRRKIRRLESLFGKGCLDDAFSVPSMTPKKKVPVPEQVLKKIGLQEYLDRRKKLCTANPRQQESEPEDCSDFIDCDTSDIKFSPKKKN